MIWGVSVFLASLLFSSYALAQKFHPVIERDVAVPMRDGVRLRVDIYRPDAKGKFPVIVDRSPYGKEKESGMGIAAAADGIVFVAEDCRGRFASAGVWYPYRVEANDGFDTVEWAARLPHANGKVALYGGSYAGVTALLAASSRPPHLVSAAVVETGSDYYNGWSYNGGVLRQLFIETWTSVLALNSIPAAKGGFAEHGSAWVNNLNAPISDYPVAYGATAKEKGFFLDFLNHPSQDSYWQQLSADPTAIQVPVLFIGGWYDPFRRNTFKTFLQVQTKGDSKAARKQSQLIVGPWTHGGFTPLQGEVNFGPAAAKDISDLTLRWLKAHLDGRTPGPHKSAISFFSMGTNNWKEAASWPPRGVHRQHLFLVSMGHANSASGDGMLLPALSKSKDDSDSFTYDPKHPVPTIGGRLCCGVVAPGAFNQSAAEKRNDVLVYSTRPLDHDLDISGYVSVHLFIKTSAPDTDFTSKLVDVSPDGTTRNVSDGIQRLRYRKTLASVIPYNPGSVTKVTIDLGPTSNVFLAGHRIRLEISSSNFPKFARNLNNMTTGYETVESSVANNTILHDRKHRSTLAFDEWEPSAISLK